MAIYDSNGQELNVCYDSDGSVLANAYDENGTVLWTAQHVDPIPSDEYQQIILDAKNAWKSEYEADSNIIPLVLSTDQHDSLSQTNWKETYDFLADAVEWNNVSACVNLGDTVNKYNVSKFTQYENCLSNIPKAKQINLWGNHDTWSSWTNSDSEVPPDEIWNTLKRYFDNSAYNGYHFMQGTKCSQYMIDANKGIKYVIAGGWDYDRSLGNHGHFVIDSDNLDSIIQMLEVVDTYDIVFLSHIQPFANNGGNTWNELYDDGNTTANPVTTRVQAIANENDTILNQMFIDRRNKASGTVTDSYGNSHNYDFTNCTSDLICCIAGHEHAHRYAIFSGISSIVFDSTNYDTYPFYFVNIDRTNNKLISYRVDRTPQYIRREIPI